MLFTADFRPNTPTPGSTIVVGMSGGVDSSVVAALLKAQGHRVIGLFMKNWEEKGKDGKCTTEADYEDVARVCSQIDIPYYTVNFAQNYWDGVFEEFLRDYRAGHTPNPDILCNREIKFKIFLDEALKLGADYLATGHYAKILRSESSGNSRYVLGKAKDLSKDQSYFIYTLQERILPHILFPLGQLDKTEVRNIARELGLATHAKKDSTGICFIGERNFPEFLGKYIRGEKGEFRTLDDKKVGNHLGVQFYTLGQRRGLGLGGQGERWFVVKKDVERNLVYVERGEPHAALYADHLQTVEESWVDRDFPSQIPTTVSGGKLKLFCKVRYRQEDQACAISRQEDGRILVEFALPQRAIALRQSIVFYDETRQLCLGGAMIDAVGPSYHERNLPLPAALGS